MPVVSKLIDCN